MCRIGLVNEHALGRGFQAWSRRESRDDACGWLRFLRVGTAAVLEPHPALLQERTTARQFRVAAPIGPEADRKLTELHPPATAARVWARAITADETAGRLALRFAAAAPTYRTRARHTPAAATRYESREKADNQGWNRTMSRVKLSGCHA
jgi:hypothetical protein